jgi:hypothetical protein
VRTIRLEAILGTLAPPALLGVLTLTAGLDVAGWVVGLAAGWGTTALLAAARAKRGEPVLPADWVTLTRAVLVAGAAALVVASSGRPQPVGALSRWPRSRWCSTRWTVRSPGGRAPPTRWGPASTARSTPS